MTATRELRMVNFPFYGHKLVPDGLRCCFVLEEGVDGKAKVFLPARLQAVRVDARQLAKAKPVDFAKQRQRETMLARIACHRRNGLAFDRESAVFVLKCLGVGSRAIRTAENAELRADLRPAPERQDHEMLTAHEARQIDAEQTRFFRALGLKLASDGKVRRQADVKVTITKSGQRLEQLQMGW
jgi:hypothetical protein